MATKSVSAPPPEPAPEEFPAEPYPDPPVPADPEPEPTFQEGYRSALDNPAHPLHHLRNA